MDTPFHPVPEQEIPVAQRGGTFFGVRLPRSVPFYDCRWDDSRPEPRNPHTGLIMWGTERAQFALGDPDSGSSSRFTHPAGILTHYDATRPANARHTAEDVRRLRSLLAREWREFRKARRNQARPGAGGGVVHKPAAVALTNFGSSILGDARTSLTYRLDGSDSSAPRRRGRRSGRAKQASSGSTLPLPFPS